MAQKNAGSACAGLWTSLPSPLTDWVLEVIQSLGYEQMTPVQASTIPLFMKHKDVVVEAVTGSGKTLAFVIPILERLIRRSTRLKKTEVGAIIISPTRELATQIHSVFQLFLESQPDLDDTHTPHPPALLLVSSEQSTPAQDVERFLETGADIIIGTPGRLDEFLHGKGANVVNTRELEVLVLDEADRLLDLGFQAVLNKIITHLPKQRRTGLFSATMTDADALSELVRVGLRNPARIIVKVQTKRQRAGMGDVGAVIEERRIPANLQNYYINCHTSEKVLQLLRIMSHERDTKGSHHIIVYFATCACVAYFNKILPKLVQDIDFYSLHGNLAPNVRTKTLDGFSSSISSPSSLSVLLATDVAARGLDIPNVDAVIQFDPPTDTKAFSHRCGRTARAGRSGTAWVLLCGRETAFPDFLSVRKIPIKERPRFLENGETAETLDQADDDRPEDPATQPTCDKIREYLKTDRALHDQSIKALVSFVRAYSKHEASYIFRVKDLDLIGVAKSYGLLRLPKMPELKERSRDGWEDVDIDWSEFKYADELQEAKRVAEALKTSQEARDKAHKIKVDIKKRNSSWSDKKDKRDERDKRKEKKVLKRQWLKSQAKEAEEAAVEGKRVREAANEGNGEDDWDALAREERAAKRVKKGQISQAAFDAEFGDL